MPHGHERTDRLLDEIDDLVESSLVRGDQSGSWQGERYDRCSVAAFEHPWHYLPVTENLEAMRRGSYAEDEFGQGIVDPDYSYNEDESRILCPGSLFLGPPTNDREWEWCVREWGPKRPSATGSLPNSQRRIPGPVVHRGSRRWRLKPIPGSWDVAVDTDFEFIRSDPDFPYSGRGHRAEDIPVGVRQTITFKFAPILDPTPEWVRTYLDYIEAIEYNTRGMHAAMRDISFEFSSIAVWAEPDPESGEVLPQHVDIVTNYPIHMHGWWNEVWTLLPEDNPGSPTCECGAIGLHIDCPVPRDHEADIVIIDEAYEMTNERLRQHVEDAGYITREEFEAQEANHQEERGSSVLCGGPQTASGHPRPVAAQAQARAHEEAIGPTDHGSQEATDEAGSTRPRQEGSC